MEDFLKGEAAPTDAQWLQLTCHVREGARILSEVKKYKSWGLDRIALHHHESYNGKGYLKKKKEELSIFEKAIAIADSFDAMTSDRAYRLRMPWDIALDDLRVCSLLSEKDDDKVYDPVVFQAFEMAICRYHDEFFKNVNSDQKSQIKLLKNANKQLKDPSKTDQLHEYKKQIENMRYYDEAYPGDCKILLYKRLEEDIKRFENKTARCFSFAFIKWKDQNNEEQVVKNIRALNKLIKNRGQKNYRISTYKDVFSVYSLTQPDRELYEILHSLPEEIQNNMKGIVSQLYKGEEGKFKACYDCLTILHIGEKPIIQFYRDIQG